jgi:transposase
LKKRVCRGKKGKRKILIADKGYRGEFCQDQAKKNQIKLEIIGKNRYPVERTHDHFKRFRKLTIRYEKKTSNYLGLFSLAAAIMVFRKVLVI